MKYRILPISGASKYSVDTNGNVYSNSRHKYPLLMTASVNNCGYYRVNIEMDDGAKVSKLVHRLVAETFIKNANNLDTVNHKDCRKTNNSADNLEWMSFQDNIDHAVLNGRMSGGRPKSYVPDDIAYMVQQEYTGAIGDRTRLMKKYKINSRQILAVLGPYTPKYEYDEDLKRMVKDIYKGYGYMGSVVKRTGLTYYVARKIIKELGL